MFLRFAAGTSVSSDGDFATSLLSSRAETCTSALFTNSRHSLESKSFKEFDQLVGMAATDLTVGYFA